MGLITGFIARKAAKKAKKEALKFASEHKEEIFDTATNLAKGAANVGKKAVNAGINLANRKNGSGASNTIGVDATENVQKETIEAEPVIYAGFSGQRAKPHTESFSEEETVKVPEKSNSASAGQRRINVDHSELSIKALLSKIDSIEDSWDYQRYQEREVRNINKLVNRYRVPKDKHSFMEMVESISSYFPTFTSDTKKAFRKKFKAIKQKSAIYFGSDDEVCEAVGELRHLLFGGVLAKRIVLVALGVAMVAGIGTGITFGVIEYNRIPDPPSASHTIYVDKSYSYFTGENYQVAVDYFVNKGFLHVTATPLHDLITGWLEKENTVKTVSINNNDTFERKTWFRPEDPVVINYHSF